MKLDKNTETLNIKYFGIIVVASSGLASPIHQNSVLKTPKTKNAQVYLVLLNIDWIAYPEFAPF